MTKQNEEKVAENTSSKKATSRKTTTKPKTRTKTKRATSTTKRTTNKSDIENIHKKLKEPFGADETYNFNGLTHIGIHPRIRRLNDIFTLKHDVYVKDLRIIPETDTDLLQAVVVLSIAITLPDGTKVIREGVGGQNFKDNIDTTVKIAYAEAYKKATDMFGMIEYITDPASEFSTKKPINTTTHKTEYNTLEMETEEYEI